MFKLSVFTDEISQDFAQAVGVAAECGCQGVEIRSVWDHSAQDLPASDITKMRDILRDKGLVVSCIAAPFYKCELDSAEEIAAHHEILRRCIDLGKALDCNLVRAFTFWRHHELDEATWHRIVEMFRVPVEIARDAGVILALENESSTYIGTGATTAKFLQAVGAPELKVIWDPQNACVTFEEDEPRPFPDGYNAVKDDIVHVHIKDCTTNRAGREFICVKVGDGEIDWPGQFQALKDDGYNGFCSLETHWSPKTISKEEMEKPGGATYAKDGEYASRQCLESINAMMAKLS